MFLSEEITKTLSLFSSYFSFELLGSVFFFFEYTSSLCVLGSTEEGEAKRGDFVFCLLLF